MDSSSSSPPLTDLALASLSLADVDFTSISTNDSVYSSRGQSHNTNMNNLEASHSNLLFTCNPNALVGALGSRPLQASCLSRTLSNRSTSSNASSVNSNRSVRFAEDKPQVRYTYPKHVYDRAPIRVDERLALKRCRNEEEPRKWVEYLIDDFNSTDALSKYDDYDWSIPGEDKVAYPSLAQLSQLPPLPPSPLEAVKVAVNKSQIQLDIFKMSATAGSGSDSDSDGSSEGCDIYRSVLCDQSPTSTPATSPASSPMSNILPSGSFAFDTADPEEQQACCSTLATPTRSTVSKDISSFGALPLFSPSYSSPSRSIPSASSPNFARWDGMYSSSLPTDLYTPLASSTSTDDFRSSIKMLQGACPGGADEKKRLRMERLKLLRERCSAQEDSFECLGGF